VRPPRELWLLGLVAFACLQIEGATGDWSAVYLRDDLGAAPGVAALGFLAFSVAMTLARVFADRVVAALGDISVVRAGRAGRRRLRARVADRQPAAAIAGAACLGLGMAGVVPIVFRAAGNVAGVGPGVALAAVSSMGYLGFLVGPPVIGGLAELTSRCNRAELAGAVGAIVALSAGRLRS